MRKEKKGAPRSVDDFLEKYHGRRRRGNAERGVGSGLERERREMKGKIETDDALRSQGMAPMEKDGSCAWPLRPADECVEGLPVFLSHALTALAISFSVFSLLSSVPAQAGKFDAAREAADSLAWVTGSPEMILMISALAFCAVFGALCVHYWGQKKEERRRTRGEFLRSILISLLMLGCAVYLSYSAA